MGYLAEGARGWILAQLSLPKSCSPDLPTDHKQRKKIQQCFKGQSNEIFDLPYFCESNPPGPLTKGIKYFRFWLRIGPVIHILS